MIGYVWVLIGSYFMFSISMIVLFVGKKIYGSDAALLWAMGLLTYISLQGIVEAFNKLKKQKENTK